jgi:hypothetical protein
MEDSPFKLCPFCKQQIRREAIKCRFCGEWLESSEADPARKLTTDKPVEPPPPPPYPQQRSDGGRSLPIVESVVAMQSETADASENRAMSAEPKKPTAWIAAAVILPLAFFSWLLLGSRLLGPFWVPGVFVLGIPTCLLPVIICALKEKVAFAAISLIGVLLFSRVQILFDAAFALAVVGAVRIAKPTSGWARRYYGPKKMAQALTRFALPKEKSDKNQKQKDSGLPAAIRRRTGWIIAGTIVGLILLVPLLVFVAGIMNGFTSARHGVAGQASFDAQHEAAAESYLENLGLEKFTSEEFGFSVMMPKERSTANMDLGTTFIGQVNGHSITVIAKDLPPSDPLYNVENVAAARAQFVVGLGRNKNVSGVESPRNVKDKNGHLGAEMVYTLTYGSTRYHEQSHVFQVSHRMCVVQVAAPEAQWDKQLADSVLTTFAMR